MKAIRAIYENGVFRPTEPVSLPDAAEVVLVPQLVQHPQTAPDGVYDVLAERYESGHVDTAARHNEHQP